MVSDVSCTALFHPEASIAFQKHHPYTGNLKIETRGDSQNAFYIVKML